VKFRTPCPELAGSSFYFDPNKQKAVFPQKCGHIFFGSDPYIILYSFDWSCACSVRLPKSASGYRNHKKAPGQKGQGLGNP
jgi:hypothetical protein